MDAQTMKVQDPNYKARTAAIFTEAGFIQDLGIKMLDCGPGWCEADLLCQPRHMQQDGVVHAGAQATLADHCAGAAANTLIKATDIILSVEFKINMLRPAQAESLWCRAEVLKPGRRLIITESEVYALYQGTRKLCSKATVTLMATAPIH